MIYEYTCDKCGQKKDIKISTFDIHTKGKFSLAIDQEKLTERINEPRPCECGGNLKKAFTDLGEPMYVEVAKHRFNPPSKLRVL